jgi:rhamnose utilization protein RhaD (predicted bifunctional aldolase and dehydrogenase)
MAPFIIANWVVLKMDDERSHFLELSSYLSGRPDLVQGSGGNISVKLAGGKMLIKASGFSFSEITSEAGSVTVNYRNVADFFRIPEGGKPLEALESGYDSVISASIIGKSGSRPSIETGFHAFLGSVVCHTHPVMVNAIACLSGWERIIRELIPKNENCLFVGYCNPGYSLAKTVSLLIGQYEKENGCKPETIFLKNHGLIVSAGTVDDAISKTEKIVSLFDGYLRQRVGGKFISFSDFTREILVQPPGQDQKPFSKFLTPDEVVYFSGNKPAFGISRKMDEILASRLWLSSTISALESLGEKPDYLKKEDVEYILNMNSEKYRQARCK